jgi:FKBP-type peptidyl-prolyl cis-trans isomerase
MKKNVFAVLTALALYVSSCQPDGPFPGFESRPNGTWIKFHKRGEVKDTSEIGGLSFIKLSLLDYKDSIFFDFNKAARMPSYPIKNLEPLFKGDIADVLGHLRKGDSATFHILRDSLNKYYPGRFTFNPKVDSMQYLRFNVFVDSVYSKEQFTVFEAKMQREQQIAQQQQMEEDKIRKEEEAKLIPEQSKLLPSVIAQNGLPAKPDAKGIYFVEKIKGTGPVLTAGTPVSVRYTGKFLNGSVFDSNVLNPDAPPLDFVLGGGMVEGFTDCILRMRDGGKAVFILPSDLGYQDGLYRLFEVEVHIQKSPKK